MGEANLSPADKPVKVCQCGCGEPVKSKSARYIVGHSSRGVVRTEAHRQRIAEAQRRIWAGKKIPGQKRCSGCKQTKPVGEFAARKNSPYVRSRCMVCEREAVERWRARVSPEQHAEMMRRARFYIEHGIRENDYLEILAAQNGVCAICGRAPDPDVRRGRLYIDHCHRTGEIRGVLCKWCNFALGGFGDNPAIIRRAADYVETARTGKFSRTRRGSRGGKKKVRPPDSPTSSE